MSKPQTAGVVFNATTWALTQLSSSVPSSDAWMKARDLLGRRPRNADEERLFDALVVSLTKQLALEAEADDLPSKEMLEEARRYGDTVEKERDDAVAALAAYKDTLDEDGHYVLDKLADINAHAYEWECRWRTASKKSDELWGELGKAKLSIAALKTKLAATGAEATIKLLNEKLYTTTKELIALRADAVKAATSGKPAAKPRTKRAPR